MRVRILKDATLTVTAGQEVDVLERGVDLLIRLGLVEVATVKTAKPKVPKKPTKKTV